MSRFSGWLTRVSGVAQTPLVACDFGSTTTKIVLGKKVVWKQATCLARHRSTKTTVAFGSKALQLLGKNSPVVEVIFPVSEGVISDMDAFVQFASAVFAEVGLQFSLQHLLGKQMGTVVTLSQLSPAETNSWQTAFRRIGVGRFALVPQAQAAARALSFGPESATACCIVDLGGKISEVAIVSAGEVVSAVRLPLGGVTLTEQIQEHIRLRHQTAVSWHTAELLKKELVYASGEPIKKKQSVRGKDVVTHLGKTIVVSGSEFVEVTQSFAEQVLSGVGTVVSEIPTELAANCLEQGLYIVGGTAQLAGIGSYLRQQLKTEVHVPREPVTVVVRGAVYT